MTHLFLWNPLNLADGEVQWFMQVLLWIGGAYLFLTALNFIAKKIFQKKQSIWIEAIYNASLKPLVYFVWFFVIVQGVDIVCDASLSDIFKQEVRLFIKLVALGSVGWALFRLKNTILANAIRNARRQEGVSDIDTIVLIAKIISAFIVFVLIMAALDVLGVSLTTILAFGGVSGLAIAFAAQEVIANFFGSIMIHITRPFRVGEYVILPEQNIEGYVRAIGWYETTLSPYSTQPTYVPNALFTKAIVLNKTRMTHRMLDETISIRLEDVSKAPQILKKISQHIEELGELDQEQKMNVWVRSIEPSGVHLGLLAMSTRLDENEFYAQRDAILLVMIDEVKAAGAELVQQISFKNV